MNGCFSFESTYKELKLNCVVIPAVVVAYLRFESTYKELKQACKNYKLNMILGFESTYKELKQYSIFFNLRN